ncbi:MAG: uroporphyrinogen-III synthase [Litoreibacter sp.]
MVSVILTRPRPQAQRFGAELRAEFGSGIDVVVSPLLRILPLIGPHEHAALKRDCDVIFTSENGVDGFAAAAEARGRRAFCVGDRTADAARAAGFEALSASGNSGDLVALISEEGGGEMLYVRGEHVARDLKSNLAEFGIPVTDVVVYTQELQPFNDVAMEQLRGEHPVIFPLFSARTSRILLEQLTQLGDALTAPLTAVCLSGNVAKQVQNTHFAEVILSKAPNAAAMRCAFGALIA